MPIRYCQALWYEKCQYYIEVLVVYFLVETPFLVNSFSALVSGRTLKVSRCIEEVTCSKVLVLL
jgi:hypothetical protein